jgi:cell division septation protein DedD
VFNYSCVQFLNDLSLVAGRVSISLKSLIRLSRPYFLAASSCALIAGIPVPGQESGSERSSQAVQDTQGQRESSGEGKSKPASQVEQAKKAGDPVSTSDGTTQAAEPPKDVGANKPATTPVPKPTLPKPINLLASDFGKTWKLFAAEEGVKVQEVWQVKDEGTLLICTGKPKGYLRTVKAYADYRLTFEFRYPMDPNGNSGVLLHGDGKDKIWPDGVQIQLHRPTAGSILPSGNRKTRFRVMAGLELLPKTWNRCEVEVRQDRVEVTINGLSVGPLQYCDPARGFIGLQAEGSEVHFRNLMLQQFNTEPTKVEPPAAAVAKQEPGSVKPPSPAAKGTGTEATPPPATPPPPPAKGASSGKKVESGDDGGSLEDSSPRL